MGFFLYSYVFHAFYQHLSRDLWHKKVRNPRYKKFGTLLSQNMIWMRLRLHGMGWVHLVVTHERETGKQPTID